MEVGGSNGWTNQTKEMSLRMTGVSEFLKAQSSSPGGPCRKGQSDVRERKKKEKETGEEVA